MKFYNQDENQKVEDVGESGGGFQFKPVHGIGLGIVAMALIGAWIYDNNSLQLLGLFSGGTSGIVSTDMDQVDSKLTAFYIARDSNLYGLEYPWAQKQWSQVTGTGGRPAVAKGSGIATYLNTINGTPEVFYLAATSQGEHVEQLWGSTWSSNDLTSATRAPAAATGSRLVGHIDSCANTDNLFYVGSDQHIRLLTWTPTRGWTSADLTRASRTGGALGTALIGHLTGASEEVFYFDARKHVHELWRWSGCPNGPRFDGWHNSDLNVANGNGAPNAMAASPLAGFYDAKANADAIFYIDTSGELRELFFSPSSWSNIDVTKVSGGPRPAAGSSLVAHVNTIAASEEVYFTDADSNVREVWAWSTSARAWNAPSYTINGQAGGAPAAAPGSPLATDMNTLANSDEVYYIGVDKEAHLLSWNQTWSSTDITAASGAPSPVP
jgi:hypothetical protein